MPCDVGVLECIFVLDFHIKLGCQFFYPYKPFQSQKEYPVQPTMLGNTGQDLVDELVLTHLTGCFSYPEEEPEADDSSSEKDRGRSPKRQRRR